MIIKFSRLLIKDLKKIKKKDARLFKRIQNKLTLFEKSPNHSSLRLHKLTGNYRNFWSISINRSIRMIYEYKKDNIVYFIDIGTHDEVYERD